MPLVERRSSERFHGCKKTLEDRFCTDSETEDDLTSSALSPLAAANNKRNLSYYAKEFDPVTFCVTKVDPKDFASQLTLLDLPVFKAIRPEELTSCSWNTKSKLLRTPNIVAFTRRFNQVCLWCQREILSADKIKIRAETLTHFIRIAKKLLQLNNLHSAFAILSGLQSNAIHPLSKTWSEISSKDRSNFDKMVKLFSDDHNFDRLRRYMSSAKLPCIPYLGLYLTDLTYIDVAHPSSGGLESTQRSLLMNNILRILSELQNSSYDTIVPLEHLQTYLKSVRYIDELQKFVEEDLYNKSIELEPRPIPKDSSLNATFLLAGDFSNLNLKNDSSSAATLDLSMLKKKKDSLHVFATTQKLKNHSLTPQAIKLGKGGHRKTMSLGANVPKNILLYTNESFSGNETMPVVLDSRRHLLDDSLLDFSATTTTNHDDEDLSAISSHEKQKMPLDVHHEHLDDSGNECDRRNLIKKLNSKRPSEAIAECSAGLLQSPCSGVDSFGSGTDGSVDVRHHQRTAVRQRRSSSATALSSNDAQNGQLLMEGSVRKRTVMKNGVKKSTLFPVYTKYWLRLKSSCQVTFYLAKRLAIRNLDSRNAYRKKSAETFSIVNWMILEAQNARRKDTFYLQEPSKGIVYKIRTGSEQKARHWVQSLKMAIKSHNETSRPSNLMTFD